MVNSIRSEFCNCTTCCSFCARSNFSVFSCVSASRSGTAVGNELDLVGKLGPPAARSGPAFASTHISNLPPAEATVASAVAEDGRDPRSTRSFHSFTSAIALCWMPLTSSGFLTGSCSSVNLDPYCHPALRPRECQSLCPSSAAAPARPPAALPLLQHVTHTLRDPTPRSIECAFASDRSSLRFGDGIDGGGSPRLCSVYTCHTSGGINPATCPNP